MTVDADREENKQMTLRYLENIVRVMAQPYSIQAQFFFDGEEMAFEFQGWYEPALDWGYLDQWTADEREALERLDSLLTEIYLINDHRLWTTGEALENSSLWEEVRETARWAMKTLHWSMDQPMHG